MATPIHGIREESPVGQQLEGTPPNTESFATGLLEHPQYTRPETFRGRAVPPVLLSGNHAAIEAWRARAAEERTLARRSDLMERRDG